MQVNVSANFARPNNTTAYASGQLVANNTSAGSVVPLSFQFNLRNGLGVVISRARLSKTSVGVTNASFRLHLFQGAAPTVANGDGGVFSSSGAATYLGALDIAVSQAFTDGATGEGVPNVGTNIVLNGGAAVATSTPAVQTGQLFGLIEARGAYTPVALETLTATLEITQNSL